MHIPLSRHAAIRAFAILAAAAPLHAGLAQHATSDSTKARSDSTRAKPPAVSGHHTVEKAGEVVEASPARKEADAHLAATKRSRTSSCAALSPVSPGDPVVPETAGPGFASFVDPTARIDGAERVMIGCHSFVAPFVSLDGTQGPIVIGDGSSLQDSSLRFRVRWW
ncbi:MAG: hypothetical protein U0163_05760 [Gemmatimonadaceae bacterium]